MTMTSIEFEHGKGNDPSNLDDGETCEDTIEFTLAFEPGDSNYGADADGNRGISVPGYAYTDDEAPLKCEECGHIYTDEERKEINEKMQKAAEDYEPDFDPPEPEPYEQEDDGMPY